MNGRSRTLIATAIFIAVALGAPAWAATAAPFDGLAPRVVNGVVTSDYPTTGALLYGSGAGAASLYCSGTLIGCRTFLTAAHCVCDTNGVDCQAAGAPNPNRFFVFLQNAGTFAVSSIAVNPQFDFPVGDLAVLTLATPVTGIAPTRIATGASPSAASPGTIVGFGRSGGNPFTNQDYGIKRAGSVSTVACDGGISDLTSVCWTFDSPVGPPGSNSNTCNGDSGGPLFVGSGGGTILAGTTSGGTSEDCLPADFSFDADVYFYRDWIRARAGADLDDETCGAIPQVGDPNTGVIAFSGSVDSGNPDGTHSFTVPPGATELRVVLNGVDDNSDFDLYVKSGSAPSTLDYDCADEGSSQFASCTFTAPAAGTWDVLVHRFAGGGPYQLTTTIFEDCAEAANAGKACDDRNACTENDSCQAGVCRGAAVTNGTACDDGSACTVPDSCQAGVCTGAALPDGTACDDGNICTPEDACQSGVCIPGPAPAPGCKTPIASGRSFLLLKDSPNSNADKLVWKWRKGQATLDFGDPTTTTDYALCLYDETSGVPALVMQERIPAGGGWTATATGFKYADGLLAHGGVDKVVLKTGTDGKASILVRGRKGNLDMTALPLQQDAETIVQLLGAGGACWEARYGTAKRNDAVQFKAKAD